MSGSHSPVPIILGFALALAAVSCSFETTTPEGTGALSLSLEVDGVTINSVTWAITSEGMEPMDGTIDTSAPGSTPSVEVFGLPPGDYTVHLLATGTDEQTECRGSEEFSIEVEEVTEIMVVLRCKPPQRFGAVRVNGKVNVCAELTKMVVAPLQTWVGDDIDVRADAEDAEGDPIMYSWTASGGTIADPAAKETSFTCDEVGEHTITVAVTDDEQHCEDGWSVDVTCMPATCPCFTLADVSAIANDPDCDPICVVARPTGLNLTALQCSVTRFDYSAVVEEFTDFGGKPLCQLNLPEGAGTVVVDLANSQRAACRSRVLQAASESGIECR